MLKRVVPVCGAVVTAVAMAASSTLPTLAQQAAPTATPVALDTFNPSAANGRTVVKWYVGLGTGAQPAQIDSEKNVVDQFNSSQSSIYLDLQIVDNRVASSTLATQIAAGNPPDIVGPVGTVGRATFDGNWLDLDPLIQANNVDLSVYEPTLVQNYNLPGQGQVGLPFAVYPSFIYYNRDLFDEAGLAYPPHHYGDAYMGKEWNFDTLRDIAMKLTVDDRGNDATSPDFAPDRIVQFGFHTQFGTKPRAIGTLFGAAKPIDANGNAVIPPNWLQAWGWFYTGEFTDHFIPNQAYRNSDLFGKDNVFNSGNLAMAYTHLWYTCCIDPVSKNGKVHNWDVCLFHFFFAWNDFLGPLVYLIGREDLWPISVGMSYFTGQFVTLPQLIQATAMMALALPVGLFLIAQRFFVQGVVVTGIDKWLKRDRIDLRAFSRILRVF